MSIGFGSSYDSYDFGWNAGFDAGHAKGAADAIRWIPCKERLPERDLDVLVYVKSWNNIQVAHIQYDGILWELSDGEFSFSKSHVSHWMPLPEPPEREVQDDD